MLFWIIAAVICLFTMFMVWRSLQGQTALTMESVQQRNIAIAQERATEIDSAFEAGEMSLEQRDQTKHDLEMALADELATSQELKDQFRAPPKGLRWVILALLPLLTFSTYRYTTNYVGHSPELAMQAEAGAPSADKAPPIEDLLAQLEEKVNADPSDQRGLFLLASSYSRMGRYTEAQRRYAQLIELAEPNADLFTDYADASAMANGQTFTQGIADTLDKALALKPDHIKALWLAGMAQRDLNQPEKALKHWLQLKPLVASDPESSSEVQNMINTVKEVLGERANDIQQSFTAQADAPTAANIDAPKLNVQVILSPEFLEELTGDETVFIFARAQTGPPMPLAAARLAVNTLPITITLDDSMAMLPQMKLSSFKNIVVGAKISKSGQAISQSGDLESELFATQNTHSGQIELLISKRVP
ncbi:MAG: c-type cytochrome biogenesis protein CcmI [Arenicellales bacterium]